ncbi:hypothetical protein Chor_007394 [Crotalus horridus]
MAAGMYLEHYLDSIENLPFELQRNFQLMRDLDQRTEDLKSEIDKLATEYISNARTLSSEEKVGLLKQIQEAYGKCKEFGDDKVQLAMQTYEMVDKHIRRLDTDLARFEADLKEKQIESSDYDSSSSKGKKNETKSKSNIEEENPDNQVMHEVNKSPTYLALEDSVASKVSKDCILEPLDGETEDGTDQGRKNTSVEENDQNESLKLNEMVELKETIDCVLHQNEEIAKSNIHLATGPGNGNMAFDENSPNSDLMKNENKLEEDSEKRYESSEVATEEVKTDETHLSMVSDTGSALGQESISESTESFKNIQILQQQINTKQCRTVVEEGTLIDAQQETGVSLNNIWGSDKGRAQKEKKAARARSKGKNSDEEAPKTAQKKLKLVRTTEYGMPSVTFGNVHPSDVLDMPVDPNEPTYCLCHQVSYGEMIGCDNPDVLSSLFPGEEEKINFIVFQGPDTVSETPSSAVGVQHSSPSPWGFVRIPNLFDTSNPKFLVLKPRQPTHGQ